MRAVRPSRGVEREREREREMASNANLKLAELAAIKLKALESAAKRMEEDSAVASSGTSNKQTAHRAMLGYKTNYGIAVLKKLVPGIFHCLPEKTQQIYVICNDHAGTTVSGYCTCFSAPACCPLISRYYQPAPDPLIRKHDDHVRNMYFKQTSRICCCCGDSEYVQLKREASKYFHIRENRYVLPPRQCHPLLRLTN